MSYSPSHRLRSLVALCLFVLGSGGAQLADALVFHGKPTTADVTRLNSGDHCHAESCDLGTPTAPPPPLGLWSTPLQLVPGIVTQALFVARPVVHASVALRLPGSRAPPSLT